MAVIALNGVARRRRRVGLATPTQVKIHKLFNMLHTLTPRGETAGASPGVSDIIPDIERFLFPDTRQTDCLEKAEWY